MTVTRMTNTQARRFLFFKHGLMGDHRFIGKQGVLAYVRQSGCIQYDPVNVCGRNAELVMQSRVRGYKPQMLNELLYQDRVLVDYFDKNLSIFPVEDWSYFQRTRALYEKGERSLEQIEAVCDRIVEVIRQRGPICSADLEMDQKVDWYWSSTRLSRAALEHMYFVGRLVVHHKKGTNKYYDLAENHIAPDILTADDPFEDDYAYQKWLVRRRIGAVGLLWNRASDAFLGIHNLKARTRNSIFHELLADGEIYQAQVEGLSDPLYYLVEDQPMVSCILNNPELKKRCECIAPLDSLLWDRKLIKALFDFEYKWEIYTPKEQRKYGHYVLPLLYGDRFIGRMEPVRQNGALVVKQIWLEPGVRHTKALSARIHSCARRLAKINDVQVIDLDGCLINHYKKGVSFRSKESTF